MALGGVFDEAEDLHGLSEAHLVAQEAAGWGSTLPLEHPANRGDLVRFVGEALPERLWLLGKLLPHSGAGAGARADHSAAGLVVYLGLTTNPFYTVTHGLCLCVCLARAEDCLLAYRGKRSRCRRRGRHLKTRRRRGSADLTVADNKLIKVRGHRSDLLEAFRGT